MHKKERGDNMRVLAIGCHPDDLEIGCGGTLRAYVERGDEVYMCHVANGNRGHKIIKPDELRVMRHQEAENAANKIGATRVYDLDIPDLEVNAADMSQKRKLIRVIKEVKPDVIITHAPQDYMQDHREVSQLVFDAEFGASIDHIEEDLEAVEIAPLYYMDTLAGIDFNPHEYVDVTDHIDTKLDALACHESQIKWMKEHDGIDFLDFVKTCAKYRGLQAGVPFAEGFQICNSWPRAVTKRLLP